MVAMPSPAMSVLKRFLESNGYDVEIIYWNIRMHKLEMEFLWLSDENVVPTEYYAELLYLNYLAVKCKDEDAYAKIKSVLYSIKPQYLSDDISFFDKHMRHYATRFESFLENELRKFDFDNILYWGISVNLYQWIFANILAHFIKRINALSVIVIGGIGTKQAAIGYLKSFRLFDFALWGEGEYSLLDLSKTIESNNSQYAKIPNLAYRDGISYDIITSDSNHNYVNLSSHQIIPDYTDYITEIGNSNPVIYKDCMLIVEGSRGCHWKKCHFCYLNNGYKHRLKDVDVIEREIRSMINEYHIYNFNFVDNDLIANDLARFSVLLERLQMIRHEFPEFSIHMAEIITRGVEASYIRMMALAGFKSVQIGYESASNNLLRKIEKKNTFSSNLLFIKFAFKYNIRISGANIICGMIEETESDISEAIENLRYLRFFLKEGFFKHNISPLGIMSSSRYFKKIKERMASFSPIDFVDLLPKGYILEEEYDKCSFLELNSQYIKSSWKNFMKVEQFYLTSCFTYSLYDKNNSFMYIEYLNNTEINRIEVEYNSLDYLILSNANDRVLSFSDLKQIISSSEKYRNLLDCEIYDIIENLRNEGLLYTPYDYSELLTVIDICSII